MSRTFALGRREPISREHEEKYPLTGPRGIATVEQFSVERVLPLPWWHWEHDQGEEGACVGHGKAMTLAILNTMQRQAADLRPATRRYDAFWLYHEAQRVDEWEGEDYSGTSVNAACKIAKDVGVLRLDKRAKALSPEAAEGISAFRWARTVDEMRQCLAFGVPVTIGVNWYSNFDAPVGKGREVYIGKGSLGSLRGGHSVCVYGASDRRQAFRVKNSWGKGYPLVWLPYGVMQRLLDEDGEAAIATDR